MRNGHHAGLRRMLEVMMAARHSDLSPAIRLKRGDYGATIHVDQYTFSNPIDAPKEFTRLFLIIIFSKKNILPTRNKTGTHESPGRKRGNLFGSPQVNGIMGYNGGIEDEQHGVEAGG